MNALADSWGFWTVLMLGLTGLYLLPIIIGLARHAEPITVIIILTVFPLLWPAAMIGVFMLPAKRPPQTRQRYLYRY